MQYVIIFAFALLINVTSTLLTRAIAKWDVRAILILSLINETLAWAPMFLVLYSDDLRMFPFAVVGGWSGDVILTRFRQLKGA